MPIVSAVVLLAACVPSAARQGLRPVTTLLTARGIDTVPLPLIDSVTTPRGLPSGPLALDSAIRLALLRSPHVRVALTDVGLAAADLWQASRVPNPVLDLMQGLARGGGPGVGNVGIGFSIVSALQTPLRRRIAASEMRGAEARVANSVYGAMIDVQRAYFDVYGAESCSEFRV